MADKDKKTLGGTIGYPDSDAEDRKPGFFDKVTALFSEGKKFPSAQPAQAPSGPPNLDQDKVRKVQKAFE